MRTVCLIVSTVRIHLAFIIDPHGFGHGTLIAAMAAIIPRIRALQYHWRAARVRPVRILIVTGTYTSLITAVQIERTSAGPRSSAEPRIRATQTFFAGQPILMSMI